MARLSINYDKSAIIHLNVDEMKVLRLRRSLRCLVSSLPIKYLGIPLGANPKRLEMWKPIISNIEKKLSGWKSILLSKASILVIIKVVLNNLPLYYLELFQMPKYVTKKIISLQSKFF